MYKIINRSQEIAKKHLESFGFEEEDIRPLITQATKDLEENLARLQEQLASSVVDREAVSGTLHALKGLLFQLGNSSVAEEIKELRMDIDSPESIAMITALLLTE